MQPDPLKDGNGKPRFNWARYYRVLTQKPLYLIVFLAILAAFLAGSWYGSRQNRPGRDRPMVAAFCTTLTP